MTDDRFLDMALQDLAGAVESALSAHPEADVFLARSRGELSAEEADALDEHLAWCRECAALQREAVAFATGEAEPSDPAEKRADWEALQARLAAPEGPAEEPDPRSAREAEPAPAARPRYAGAVAAALAVLLAGAGLWILRLDHRLEEAGSPRPNVPLLDLSPAAERSAEAAAPAVDPGHGAVLILNPRATLDGDDYRLSILDAEGVTRRTVPGLTPTDHGNLTLELPAGSLPPGTYRLLLETSDGGEVVETFRLRVAGPGTAPGSGGAG